MEVNEKKKKFLGRKPRTESVGLCLCLVVKAGGLVRVRVPNLETRMMAIQYICLFKLLL